MINRCLMRPPVAGMPRPAVPLNARSVTLFFYRRFPHWFMPKRICAWCGFVIGRGGIFSRGKTSHGVCGHCSEEAMEQARMARGIRLAAAAFFLAAALLTADCSRSTGTIDDQVVYRSHRHRAVSVTWSNDDKQPSVEVFP